MHCCIGEGDNWHRRDLIAASRSPAGLFIAPALVLLGLFMVYPIVWSLWMSFQVGKGMNLSFGGFANIVRLTKDPVFLRALGNTFIFFVVQVPIMIVLALLFAVALNDSDAAVPRLLPHRDLPALRHLAGRLFDRCSSRCSPSTASSTRR